VGLADGHAVAIPMDVSEKKLREGADINVGCDDFRSDESKGSKERREERR
jgi:hypothetical protein